MRRTPLVLLACFCVWALGAALAGDDEFGRPVLSVLLASLAISVARGSAVAAVLIGLVTALVLAAQATSGGFRRAVGFFLDAVESVPTYLWVLAAVAAAPRWPTVAVAAALLAGMAPVVYAAVDGLVANVRRQTFVLAAIACGESRLTVLRLHVFPHVAGPVSALVLNVIGASVAIYGAIGAFGFANRQNADLGTLLLRGKEMAPLDASLLWLTLAAYGLLYLLLELVGMAIAARFRVPLARELRKPARAAT